MLRCIMAELIEITEERAGQRIDNYLFNLLTGVPKSRVYKAIRKGEVRVNKKRIDAFYKLATNDIVRIPPVQINETPEPIVGHSIVDLLRQSILYEDNQIIVLNKPSGIPVHGGTNTSYGVIDALRKAYPEYKSLELIHRLDKDTSGCLLIAKKRSALTYFHDLLREGKMIKEYLCLAQGQWTGDKRRVDARLRKNILQSGERMVRVDPEGKEAVTDFYLEHQYQDASLLKARLHTGRTHQIRVHLQSIHHPIAGDDKYGDKEFTKKMRQYGLKRMFLHAASLQFHLPETNELLRVSAPLESSLQTCLKKLP
jgi:23S rRNA pseudouridine955/2504/2580 synthase